MPLVGGAGTTPRIATTAEAFDGQTVIEREVLPDGRTKLILKYSASGGYADRIVAGDCSRPARPTS